MKPHGIHHVGITVPDLDRAIDFHAGVLGTKLDDPPTQVFDDADLDEKLGLADVDTIDEGVLAGWRWAYFRDPFGTVVELVEIAYRDDDAGAEGIAGYRAARAPGA
jgi:catechol 2,3-dioxygenase-like lactoylglutathione lyase family enzyme